MGRRRRSSREEPKRRGYLYRVMKAVQGGATERVMKDAEFTDKKEAESFYRKHPKATRIQRISKEGWTAGTFQPDVPKTITHKGKTLKKVYLGPHRKKLAEAIVTDFRKNGLNAKTRKTKRGYYIYAE